MASISCKKSLFSDIWNSGDFSISEIHFPTSKIIFRYTKISCISDIWRSFTDIGIFFFDIGKSFTDIQKLAKFLILENDSNISSAPPFERISFSKHQYNLGWRKEWICSERPITIRPIVRSWTHARSTRFGISVRSRGNKDQSGLSYWLHYRETLSPPSAGDAQSTNFGLLAAICWHWLRLACSGWLAGFESSVWSSTIQHKYSRC